MENKVIITVVGKDTVGIIAGVCTYLAKEGVNVLNITQTIVNGYFNMMMIVDISTGKAGFGQIAKNLKEIGESLGVEIVSRKEEIFEQMHRV